MTVRRNRLFIGVPGYGAVQFKWVQHWLKFQAEIANAQGKIVAEGGTPERVGLHLPEMAYPDAAMNNIVVEFLKTSADYLVVLEHDNIPPTGWVERLMSLNPETERVVGCLYFGRAQEDMRPIPGNIDADGNFNRLTVDEVKAMLAEPGLYKVDVVGMGATAIHRSVFENWNPPAEYDFGSVPEGEMRKDWFQRGVKKQGFLGHDLGFCMAAAAQGHTIWCDSSMVAGHIGTWVSDAASYLATQENAARKRAMEDARPRKFEILKGVS